MVNSQWQVTFDRGGWLCAGRGRRRTGSCTGGWLCASIPTSRRTWPKDAYYCSKSLQNPAYKSRSKQPRTFYRSDALTATGHESCPVACHWPRVRTEACHMSQVTIEAAARGRVQATVRGLRGLTSGGPQQSESHSRPHESISGHRLTAEFKGPALAVGPLLAAEGM